ncbi:MAG: CAP domain-containing protein [Bosea sp.]|uniref:CAP domain-containing protein n=1 Tax=Bosea sp. (in: a-proteobacteria) TaxID=1871050 RepID=UPI001AD06BB8|nr:CAP domain-containing protein [Bosea sp. (in: a-proteobacteria)]MBN9470153.1 CAP domain-containing protein [Bosea sp. (in: a-proteobacteria)]
MSMMSPSGAALLAALFLAGCAGSQRETIAPNAKRQERLAAVRLDPAEAVRILNAHRAERGLGAVRLDPALTTMAQRQADAMAASDSLSHTAAGTFTARVHAAGLDTVRAAENLGAGYFSTQEAFEGWKKSSGHAANLVMPQATRMGIALAKNPQTRYGAWWTIVLAAEPEKRQELSAGPLVPASGRGTTTFRWGPPL